MKERGIRSILNVAREVNSPFDSAASSQPLRPFVSTPDLKEKVRGLEDTYYPPHGPSGRPPMHYLKLPWSHGQSDLVQDGFVAAMTFIDAALDRGDGVLIQYAFHSGFYPYYAHVAASKLPMRRLTFGDRGHRSGYACRSAAIALGSTRGMGSEGLRHARCVQLRQRAK